MPITSVTPQKAVRGEAGTGTLITIAGTGFGAVIGAGTLTLGGVAMIVGTWSDTAVGARADNSPATPLGAQDLVLTPDGGSAMTVKKAVYVYDDTNVEDATELLVPFIDKVYIAGLDVGLHNGDVEVPAPDEMQVEHKAGDRFLPHAITVVGSRGAISFSLKQINGLNLAQALGGTYDPALDIVTIPATRTISAVDIMIPYTGSRVLYAYGCRLLARSGYSIRAEQESVIPMTFAVWGVENADGSQGSLFRFDEAN